MKIQPVTTQTEQTNFKAKKVTQIITHLADGGKDVVDIYKLSSKDKPFIERCLLVLQGKDRHIADDSMGVYGFKPKKALKQFFKDIIFSGLKKNTDSYIAIKNDQQIEGVASMIHVMERSFLNNLIMINNKNDINTRKGLALSCFKFAPKGNSFVIQNGLRHGQTASFFKTLGFKTPIHSGRVLASEKPEYSKSLAKTVTNVADKTNATIINIKSETEVDLQKVMKLDE